MRKNNSALQFNETNGDLSLYCDEFKTAVDLYDVESTEKSQHYFQLAYESVNRNDLYHNKYASYCGISRLVNGDRSGLELCRDAARSEISDGDVFLNLARAEWYFKNRKKTVQALEKGLQINSSHPGLLEMHQQLGMRKRNIVSILNRNHIINTYLGKLLRKKN